MINLQITKNCTGNGAVLFMIILQAERDCHWEIAFRER